MKYTWKKVLTGALLVSMTGTLMIPMQAQAAETKSTEENSTLESIVEGAVTTEKEAEKEETVYVKADAEGNVSKVTVSDWLKNTDGEAELTDDSQLTDIKNIKGDESFTENSDGTITWAANGNDIYYQGTTDKNVPVSVKISYKLDGKKMTPAEMAGKSGKVTIRFDYSIDKDSSDLAFTAITGMLLDEDVFSNVKVTNGKVVNEGKSMILLGYALPGLKETLGISDDDLLGGEVSVPEYVEVTADVTDFEMGMTFTMASADLLSGVDLSGKLSAGDVKASIEKLSDSSNQLADGTKELDEGVSQLKDGLAAYTEGVSKLNNGLNSAEEGAQQLIAGYEGSGSTSGAVAGAQQVAAGASQVSTGADQLKSGVDTLVTQLNAAVTAIDPSTYAAAAGAATQENLMAAANAYAQAVAAGDEATAAAAAQQLGSVAQAFGAAGAYQALSQVQSQLSGGLGGLSDLQDGAAAVADGAAQVSGGAAQLAANTPALSQGASQVSGGASSLSSGVNKLYNGTVQLADGISQASDGAETLTGNSSKLTSGIDKLKEGTGTLSDGMLQFNEQGIDKLVSLYNDNIAGLADKAEKLKESADAYGAFSGSAEGTKATTKFIIETEGISK